MSTMFTPFKTAVAACALLMLCGAPILARAQDQSSSPSQTAPDNSARNKNHTTTADQQPENKTDLEITRDIREAIVADKSLSTYAHNVKIMTQNGAVTLRGPVNSVEERQTVAAKAANVAGGPDKVTNQLTVKQ